MRQSRRGAKRTCEVLQRRPQTAMTASQGSLRSREQPTGVEHCGAPAHQHCGHTSGEVVARPYAHKQEKRHGAAHLKLGEVDGGPEMDLRAVGARNQHVQGQQLVPASHLNHKRHMCVRRRHQGRGNKATTQTSPSEGVAAPQPARVHDTTVPTARQQQTNKQTKQNKTKQSKTNNPRTTASSRMDNGMRAGAAGDAYDCTRSSSAPSAWYSTAITVFSNTSRNASSPRRPGRRVADAAPPDPGCDHTRPPGPGGKEEAVAGCGYRPDPDPDPDPDPRPRPRPGPGPGPDPKPKPKPESRSGPGRKPAVADSGATWRAAPRQPALPAATRDATSWARRAASTAPAAEETLERAVEPMKSARRVSSGNDAASSVSGAPPPREEAELALRRRWAHRCCCCCCCCCCCNGGGGGGPPAAAVAGARAGASTAPARWSSAWRGSWSGCHSARTGSDPRRWRRWGGCGCGCGCGGCWCWCWCWCRRDGGHRGRAPPKPERGGWKWEGSEDNDGGGATSGTNGATAAVPPEAALPT